MSLISHLYNSPKSSKATSTGKVRLRWAQQDPTGNGDRNPVFSRNSLATQRRLGNPKRFDGFKPPKPRQTPDYSLTKVAPNWNNKLRVITGDLPAVALDTARKVDHVVMPEPIMGSPMGKLPEALKAEVAGLNPKAYIEQLDADMLAARRREKSNPLAGQSPVTTPQPRFYTWPDRRPVY